jgi:hypothetical protein
VRWSNIKPNGRQLTVCSGSSCGIVAAESFVGEFGIHFLIGSPAGKANLEMDGSMLSDEWHCASQNLIVPIGEKQ